MEHKDYRLSAIVYTDIAGFSRMMERDEAGALELLHLHQKLIGDIASSHHGTLIKTMGDALLLDFTNTVEALQSALEIQQRLYERNRERRGMPLLVRIGIHLGEIHFFENDALGEGINIAAQLQSLARPGGICFSQEVHNLVVNKLEFKAERLGAVPLKNAAKEVQAYEISTANQEFDPERGAPRPGSAGSVPGGAGGSAPKAAPGTAGTARDRVPGNSGDLLAEIRSTILRDCKSLGRRMTVDEARERYGYYGVEAAEVIANMADQGILARASRGPFAAPSGPQAPRPGQPPFAPFAIPGQAPFDPQMIGRNIEAVVQGIVGEIERSVERSKGRDRHGERDRRHEARDALRRELSEGETGKWDRKLMEDEEWKPGDEELSRDFAYYRDRLAARCRRSRAGLVGNLVSYAAVNALLWYLNLGSSRGFLWAAIVSAAWGIGVVSSIVAARRSGAKLREIDAMPDFDSGQLELYKKLNRMKDSLAQHSASTLTVPILLGTINFLTDASFPWFIIPSVAMAIGYLSHLAAYRAAKPRIERKLLDSLGVKGAWRDLFRGAKARREETSSLGPYADDYREAQAARNAIAAQLASGQAGPVDEELLPSLDQYLGQVRLLAQSANEIDRLVGAIPMPDLEKDKAALAAKREASASESLRAEYGRSIEEIERQERSYRELGEQSEVIKLRLGSSVNQLKQMRIDMARVQASPDSGSPSGIDTIRLRTDELSRYLEDLRSGYDETHRDPFAELEEAERKRLAETGGSEGKGNEG